MFLILLFAFIMAANAGVIERSDPKLVADLGDSLNNLGVQTVICVVIDGKITYFFTPTQLYSYITTLNQVTASTTLIVLSDSFSTVSDAHKVIEGAFSFHQKSFVIILTRKQTSDGTNTSIAVHNNKCIYKEPVQEVKQGLGIIGDIYSYVRVITALEKVCDVAQFNILNDALKGFTLIG